MTIREYFRRCWRDGQRICELEAETGKLAKPADDFHGLATHYHRGLWVCAACFEEHCQSRPGVARGYGMSQRSA